MISGAINVYDYNLNQYNLFSWTCFSWILVHITSYTHTHPLTYTHTDAHDMGSSIIIIIVNWARTKKNIYTTVKLWNDC